MKISDCFHIGPVITDIVNNTINTRGGEVFIYGENFGNGSIDPVVHFDGSDIPVYISSIFFPIHHQQKKKTEK